MNDFLHGLLGALAGGAVMLFISYFLTGYWNSRGK